MKTFHNIVYKKMKVLIRLDWPDGKFNDCELSRRPHKISERAINTYLWVFAAFRLLKAIVQGSNHFLESGFRAANFAKVIKGRKLNGTILRELEMASEISCQFECFSEDRCMSYNFLSIHGNETSTCQNATKWSDRFVSRVNFTKEDGALFKGIQVIILVGVSIRELWGVELNLMEWEGWRVKIFNSGS